MAFKGFDKLAQEQKELWDDKVSDWVKERLKNPLPIGRREWDGLRMNSFEREELLPRVTDEVLAYCIEYSLKNCTRIPTRYGRELPITYDDSIKIYAREAAKRLKEIA